MEKKSNMPNADELCIEYVLNELDPSEAVMVERAMQNDMNLLIEIECFRRTLKKLEELPYQSPPPNVRNAIIQQAITHYQQNRQTLAPRWNTRWNNTTVMATAAAVIFSVMISVANLYTDSGITTEQATADQPGIQSTENAAEVNPWIDRNNVLHINQFRTETGIISAGNSDLNHSLQQLRPVQPTMPLSPAFRDIHLTRSTQN